MTATSVTKMSSWEDPPQEGRSADDWPYPTKYIKFLVGGDLANRVAARLGLPEGTPVFLTEEQVSGGYSEYTQETDISFRIDCGPHSIDDASLPYGYGMTGVGRLDAWLKATS